MLNVLIITLAAILLGGLLYFEKQGNPKRVLPTKTLLSCLFIITALLQPHPLPGYFYLLLMGLIFCFCADWFHFCWGMFSTLLRFSPSPICINGPGSVWVSVWCSVAGSIFG
jgi:hypothetical protein